MYRLDRRRFLQAAASGAVMCAMGRGVSEGTRKPNIVFILADDLGRHQIACYGSSSFYETPNIDRIAREGMMFSDAYAAAPVCSPTRASIMTGKYPARLHLTDYIAGPPYPYAKVKTPDWTKELPAGETTLPEVLAGAGYVSGHFGKWHLSKDKEYRPGRPGDPDTQGFSDVLTRDKPEGRESAKAGADPNYDAHHAREITDRAIAFMETHATRPFFCYIAHSLIHRPEMEYTPHILKYARKAEACNEMGRNPVLGAMVETLDRQVGRVLDAIDRLGIADNTILVFFSDNGDLYGRNGLKPLYGAKADLYEGGVRMPLLIRWPEVIPAGARSDALISSVDFLPTFAEIAGAPLPVTDIDGLSFANAVYQKDSPPNRAIFWHYPHYHSLGLGPCGAIREGKWKLIEWFEKSIDGAQTEGALQLFDLEIDIGEQHDLSREMPDRAAMLCEKLRAWRQAVGAQEMALNPEYDPARAGEPE